MHRGSYRGRIIINSKRYYENIQSFHIFIRSIGNCIFAKIVTRCHIVVGEFIHVRQY